MRTRALVATVLLILPACTGTRVPANQGGAAPMTREHPAAMRAPGWLDLRSLSVHTDAEKEAPREPYVRGAWVGGWFDASGEVVGAVGEPPRGRSVTRGYLELRSRSFFRNDATRVRMPPWVEGSRDDESGSFFPAGQIVWSNP